MMQSAAQTAGSGLQQASNAFIDYGLDQQEKADRAAVADASAEWQLGLTELDTQFANDQEPGTVSERYREEAERLRAKVAEQLPESVRERFIDDANHDIATSLRGVNRQALSVAGDQKRAWLNENLADLRRKYIETGSPEQRANILRAANEAVASAMVSGAIDEETAGNIRRKFAQTAVADGVSVLPDAEQIRVLSGDNPITKTLDPVTRAEMLKQARARREVFVREEVRDAVTVLEAGKIPPNLDIVKAAAAGTKYGPILRQAEQDRGALEEFARKPLAEQGSILQSYADRESATAREVRLADRQAKIFNSARTAIRKGQGLLVADGTGVVELERSEDVLSSSFLQRRAAQAEVASEWAGTRISPLLPDERAALKDAIDEASPSEVTGVLQTLHAGLGRERAVDVAGDLVPSRPELAVAIGLAPDLPGVSRDIVNGARLIAKNPEARPGKAEHRAALDSVVGNMLTPESAQSMDAYLAAADALYANSYVTGEGDFEYDEDAYEQALTVVLGGPLEFNDRTILPPIPGMEQDLFDDAMDALTQPDLIEFGNGVPMMGDDSFTVDMFDRGLFHEDAELVSVGFGKYGIVVPGLGTVLTADGDVYVLNLRAMLEALNVQ